MTTITSIISTVTAAFLGSFVEVVEAFTIILAVGVTQSWRPAFIGYCHVNWAAVACLTGWA
ncbi:hypothetical protein GR247_36560 [Rhizobium leguminosarum]|nr:hypothetical protein [Rhizobium leguminosarum]